MKKTLKFEIVTGIKAGYKNLKAGEKDKENIVANLWQKNAKEEFEVTGIYVSAVIKRSYTVYNEDFGCPKGGERTVVITGVAYDEYAYNIENWKNTVIVLAKKLKSQLKQEKISCEFMETEFLYL